MAMQWDEETNVKKLNYAHVFQEGESLQVVKDRIANLPDNVPANSRVEVEIYVRLIEKIIP